MNTGIDKLYTLEADDIPQAVNVLFDAFQHDPVFNAIFEGATREQRNPLYETTVRYCLHYGQVWGSSPNLEGVAGWVRGKYASLTPWRMLVSGAIWPGLKMGQAYSQRMSKVFKPVDEGRKRHMAGKPFLYLFMIGVAGEHQGKGYGRVLLDEVIRFAEREGLPVYLETETEENVRLYEHFGFEVIEKVDLPLVHLPMWEMVRHPQNT
jgi:ribosomal protein S18 acetylase RimI-like enzyme